MSPPLCPTTRPPVYDALIGRWREGERASAREALSKNPELGEHKSIVLDLALEEYRLRRASGETIRPSTFCEQFPGFRHSLRRMFTVCRHLEGEPELYEAFMAEALARLEAELAAQALLYPDPGQTFLGFEVLENLGKGGFARVYLARQHELGGRLVALKVAKQKGAKAEAKQGRLQHPNIVPVHSIDTDPQTGLTAICMPFLGRATLVDVLDAAFVRFDAPTSAAIIGQVAQGRAASQAEIPPGGKATYVEAAAGIVLQLAEALAYTHGQGILHRDLKPSNVLLTPQGVPMLLDFNLSIEFQDFESAVGGTLPYMAPELVPWVASETPNPAGINSPRTDIFSLGAIFHELLTGTLPYGEPEPTRDVCRAVKEMLSLHSAGFPAASKRNSQVEPEIDRIIARCLAIEPADRYATAEDFAHDLRQYLSPGEQRKRWARRNRRAFLALGAVAVVLGCGMGVGAAVGVRKISSAELDRGLLEYGRGEFAQAKIHFDAHLERHPTDGEALLARGKTYWKLKESERAKEDFLKAARYSKTGESRAWRAYCLSLQDSHRPAALEYKEAIDAGMKSAIVYNNRGYSLIQTEQLKEAQHELDLAIKIDPNLPQAWKNRIHVELALALHDDQLPSRETLDKLGQVATLKRPDRHLLLNSARLFALCARERPEFRRRATHLLILAIDQGLVESQLAAIPELQDYTTNQGVREAFLNPTSEDIHPPLESVLPPE